MQAIEEQSGEAISLPLISIAPPVDIQPLHELAEHLPEFALAIFISANAAQQGVPVLLASNARRWPAGTQAAAIGPGTARVLAALGVESCLTPPLKGKRFDSETLLALPELSADAISGQRIAIVRGEGGRDLLSETLKAKGALVFDVPCYRRIPRSTGWEPLYEAWDNGTLDAITISSSEALRHLEGILPPDRRVCLQETPLFAPHPRIIATAAALGLTKLVQTAPMDEGIVSGLCAYNWPGSEPDK